VFVQIQGVQHYLWRVVDQDGVGLDILVQPRRDASAAKCFFIAICAAVDEVLEVIVHNGLVSRSGLINGNAALA